VKDENERKYMHVANELRQKKKEKERKKEKKKEKRKRRQSKGERDAA